MASWRVRHIRSIPPPGASTSPTILIRNSPGAPYACGFVPNLTIDPANGSDSGACCFADNRGCKIISTADAATPGRACLEQGGIFVPAEQGGSVCGSTLPSAVNFTLANGYYVFNLVTNDLKTRSVNVYPLTDPRARMYSPTETTDALLKWVNSQPDGQPWMATASYASIHAPYQQAPQSLTPGEPDLSGVACNGSLADLHQLSDQMLQAMDSEIGRLLAGIGLASKRADGTLEYDPGASNTMVIVIGDNGTYSQSVKAPFDIQHAKGFVNQTGVWVP